MVYVLSCNIRFMEYFGISPHEPVFCPGIIAAADFGVSLEICRGEIIRTLTKRV